ncbi:retropepsin-like aspartic protease family protein [Microvirga rosea]|uniref:retropepsin-like aspartic protease family protein n=1 Tax=Microvirga rosea TaxID=2715425 RepID=UPI001D0A81E0|nr:TIGR02281 family clan AA aspartic protease [Microvirga rosea]MCB8820010.1 TIGR02281 family clan AA aspartic protease [Microvirga rosea]
MTMPGIRPLGGALLAAALLVATMGETAVAGLQPTQVALLLAFFGCSLYMAAGIVDGFAQHWTHGVQATAVSGGLLVAALVVYAARDDLQMVLDRAIGDIADGRAVVTDKGEIVAAKRSDGSFPLNGRVNGREARFVFDTGASTVVLRAEHAADFGFREEDLNFSIPVATANGVALAAPVTIGALSIGSITERNVPALVTRSGALHTNLLGMSFLERLASYEVRGNRLILRPKEPSPAG